MTTNAGNECNLREQKDSWVIHGVWPSKTTTFGPEYCPNELPIQMNAMESIIDRLRQHWPNMYKGNQIVLSGNFGLDF